MGIYYRHLRICDKCRNLVHVAMETGALEALNDCGGENVHVGQIVNPLQNTDSQSQEDSLSGARKRLSYDRAPGMLTFDT